MNEAPRSPMRPAEGSGGDAFTATHWTQITLAARDDETPEAREALETLGVPVVGFRTDRFPAFYQRESAGGVDARFEDAGDLAEFVRTELARSSRGVLVVNPVPAEHEIEAGKWRTWLDLAMERARATGAAGRDLTPALLAAVHDLSGGETLRANIELVMSNTALAAQISARL